MLQYIEDTLPAGFLEKYIMNHKKNDTLEEIEQPFRIMSMDYIGLVDPYASAYDSDSEDIDVELIYKNIKAE
mgnify:CR=1 FL=1